MLLKTSFPTTSLQEAFNDKGALDKGLALPPRGGGP